MQYARFFRTLAVLTTVAMGVACSSNEPAPNTICEPGSALVNAECRRLCNTNADCHEGEVCVDTVCFPEDAGNSIVVINGTVAINNGSLLTRTTEVTLHLTAELATQVYVTEEFGCPAEGAEWLPTVEEFSYVLQQTNRVVDVYVQFQDDNQNLSECYHVSIQHDDVAPNAVPGFDDTAYTSSNTSVPLVWTATTDPAVGSDIDYYEVALGSTPGGTDVSDWTNIGAATSVTITGLTLVDGTRYYASVRAVDRAGNTSVITNGDGWYANLSPPGGLSISIKDPNTNSTLFTKSSTVTATLTATSAASNAYMYVTNVAGCGSGGSYELMNVVGSTVKTDVALNSSDLNGQAHIYVKFRDDLMLETGCISAVIQHDSVGPSAISGFDDTAFTDSLTSVALTWNAAVDPGSGSGIGNYEVAIGTTPGGTDKLDWTVTGSATSATITGLSLTADSRYYASVRAVDRALNTGAVTNSDGWYVDVDPPSGLSVSIKDPDTNSTLYTKSASVTATLTASDTVANSYVCVTNTAGCGSCSSYQLMNTVGSTTITGVDLNLSEFNNQAFVYAKFRDDLMHETACINAMIQHDNVAPNAVSNLNDTVFTNSISSVALSWAAATDPSIGTGVGNYEYAIGSTPGGVDKRNWTTSNSTSITVTGLSLSGNTRYYASVRAVDRALNTGAIINSDGWFVDVEPPSGLSISIADPTTHSTMYTSSNTVTATLTATDAVSNSYMCVTNIAGCASCSSYQLMNAVGNTTVAGVELNLGEFNNQAFVYAKFRDDSMHETACINAMIQHDNVGPGAVSNLNDTEITNSITSVELTWSAATDPVVGSGIGNYEVAIGSTPGGTDKRNWAVTGAATSATITGLTLLDGVRYYASIRAVDRARNTGAISNSDGWFVDVSPPMGLSISIADPTTSSTLYTSSNTVTATLIATDVVSNSYMCVTNVAGCGTGCSYELMNVVGSTIKTGVELKLSQFNNQAFVYAKFRDDSMHETACINAMIQHDNVAPSAVTNLDDTVITNSISSVALSWTAATDPSIGTGVGNYEYAIGSTPGGVDKRNWTTSSSTSITVTGLSLSANTRYYASVRAIDRALNTGAIINSDGWFVDVEPPSGLSISIADPTTHSTMYTSSNTVTATLTATDAVSNSYMCVTNIAGCASCSSYQLMNAVGNTTVAGVELNLGEFNNQAFVYAKFRDDSMHETACINAMIQHDNVAPSAVSNLNDTVFTNSITSVALSWTAATDPDVGTGIGNYEYAIGSTPGGTDKRNWTSTSSTSVTVTGLSLSADTRYYASVRAVDRALNTGTIVNSDGWFVDVDPPSGLSISIKDPNTQSTLFTSSNTVTATLTATDAVSNSYMCVTNIAGCGGCSSYQLMNTVGSTTAAGVELNLSEFNNQAFVYAKFRDDSMHETACINAVIQHDNVAPSAVSNLNDTAYTNSISSVALSWTAATDPSIGTGIGNYEYAIGTTPGGTDRRTWTSTNSVAASLNVTGLSLTANTRYYASVRAVDRALNTGLIINSDGWYADVDPPTGLSISIKDPNTNSTLYTNSTTVTATLTATDAVSNSYMCVTNVAGCGGCSYELMNAVGSTIKTGVLLNSLQFNNQAFIFAKFRDELLHETACINAVIQHDNVAPSAVSNLNDTAYTNSISSVALSWTAATDPSIGTGIGNYEYAIGTTPGGTDRRTWTSTNSVAASLNVTGLSLTANTRYYASVRAVDRALNTGLIINSDGWYADVDPPTGLSISIKDPNTNSTLYTNSTTVTATLTATDVSNSYMCVTNAVGCAGCTYELMNAVGNTIKTGVLLNALQANNNARIYAKFRDELLHETSCINAVIIYDTLPPNAFAGFQSPPYYASTTEILLNWVATTDDTSTGVYSNLARYEVAIGLSAGATDVRNWTSVGLGTNSLFNGLTLTSGTRYWPSLRAVDNATNVRSISVNGWIADTTAPTAGSVSINSGAPYTNSSTVNLQFAATDAIPTQVLVANSASACSAETGTWQNSLIQQSWPLGPLNNTVRVYAKFRDVVLNTASLCVNSVIHHDNLGPLAPGSITNIIASDSTTEFDLTWTTAVDNSVNALPSGIARYEVSIGTGTSAALFNNVLNWYTVGNAIATSFTVPISPPLAQGVPYYATLRAVDNAGNLGANIISNAWRVDVDPPGFTSFSLADTATGDPLYTNTNNVTGTFVANDQTNLYVYLTTNALCNTGGTYVAINNVGTSIRTGVVLNTLNNVSRVYAKVFDQLGFEGATGHSSGCINAAIQHDNVAPSAISGLDDTVITNSITGVSLTWTAATDPGGSGIGNYEYAIGTTPGGTDKRSWTSTSSTATVINVTGLSLTTNTPYYASLRAVDRARNTGAITNSNGWWADISPPSALSISLKDPITNSTVFTNSSSVTATLTAMDAVSYSYMCVTNAAGCAGCSSYEVMNAVGPTIKTNVSLNTNELNNRAYIYAKFRDELLHETSCINAMIIHSNTQPLAPIVASGLYNSVNGKPMWTWATNSVKPGGSGIFQYKFGASGTLSSASTTNSLTLSGVVNSQLYTLYVREQDFGGTWSAFATADSGGVLQVVAGSTGISNVDGHACVLLTGGKVKCWGGNFQIGQLGYGDSITRSKSENVPNIDLGSNRVATQITAGAQHVCAVLDDQTVKCWGQGNTGRLGLGDTSNRGLSPNQMGNNLPAVNLGNRVLQISAGLSHTCALLEGSKIKCWGNNADGQLGLGHTTTIGPTANTVASSGTVDLGPGLTPVQVVAGRTHTCALLVGGMVKCWGVNGSGQLGQNDLITRGNNPTLNTVALSNVLNSAPGVIMNAVALALGEVNTCALLADGSVKCWGSGAYNGQDSNTTRGGDATNTLESGTAVALGQTARAIASANTGRHTCAILLDNSVKCWGENAYGQLGENSTTIRGDSGHPMSGAIPVNLGAGRFAKQIAATGNFTCAVLDDGSTKCWGQNESGALGLGHRPSAGTFAADMGDNLPAIDVGGTIPDDGLGIASGGTFGDHFCVRLSTGAAKCWGNNDSGYLGQNDMVPRGKQSGEVANLSPIAIGSSVLEISTGTRFSCARFAGASVKCWGLNTSAQLGQDDYQHRGHHPDWSVANIDDINLGGGTITRIRSGGFHSCVIVSTGLANVVKCWGHNGAGQLGLNDTAQRGSPTISVSTTHEVNGLSDVIDLSLGTGHSCAVTGSKQVKCWGDGTSGQLGYNDTTARGTAANPMESYGFVNGITNAVGVSAGISHTCVLLDDGRIKCWGLNANGQLGLNHSTAQGNSDANRVDLLPFVANIINATQVEAGSNSTCAVISGGTLKCWGDNTYGQLGVGDTSPRGGSAGSMNTVAPVNLGAGRTVKSVRGFGSRNCALLDNLTMKCWGRYDDKPTGTGDYAYCDAGTECPDHLTPALIY